MTADTVYRKIHQSEYGDSPVNFHVNKYGNELHVELTYPPWTEADDTKGQCRYIRVNQEATRASDGVRLYYDYDRDGFVVQQPKPHLRLIKDSHYDSWEEWIEVGFFPSWRFDQSDDEQMAEADRIATQDKP